MGENVRDVNTDQFAAEVLERSATMPVVVDFWATWCGPCRVLGPILERAAAEADGEWELVKVDVDQNQQLASSYGVQGIPTVIGFRDRAAAARFTGALPEAQVRQWLKELAPSRLDRLAAQGRVDAEAGEPEAAEAAFREVLVADPTNVEARLGLASILLDQGNVEEASRLLDGLAETDEVRRLQARVRTNQDTGDISELASRVMADPDDSSARLELGRALAGAGSFEEALQHLQEVVEAGGDAAESARQTMLDVFELLGDDPLVGEYRRRLANALF